MGTLILCGGVPNRNAEVGKQLKRCFIALRDPHPNEREIECRWEPVLNYVKAVKANDLIDSFQPVLKRVEVRKHGSRHYQMSGFEALILNNPTKISDAQQSSFGFKRIGLTLKSILGGEACIGIRALKVLAHPAALVDELYREDVCHVYLSDVLLPKTCRHHLQMLLVLLPRVLTHLPNGYKRRYYRCKTGNERLKIVQDTPEAIGFVTSHESKKKPNSIDFVTTADQLSCRLKGDEHCEANKEENTCHNPRELSGLLPIISHPAPALTESSLVQIVVRDRTEGKA